MLQKPAIPVQFTSILIPIHRGGCELEMGRSSANIKVWLNVWLSNMFGRTLALFVALRLRR